VNEFDPDRLLDVEEAAGLLQVKPGTLYSWVSKGKIPHRKVGALVRFHRAELMAWTMEQVKQGEPKRVQTSKLRVVQ
jgi:excisionase family DNA binding protein